MSKNIWGPKLWYIIHGIAYLYPESDNQNIKYFYYQFIQFIYEIIPCPSCQKHFLRLLKNHKLEINKLNKEYLVNWTVQIHNQINTRLHKSHFNRDTTHYKNINHKIFIWYINYLGIEVLKNNIRRNIFVKFILFLTYIVPKGNIWKKLFNINHFSNVSNINFHKNLKKIIHELYKLES